MEKQDRSLFMVGTEVRSKHSDSHLGHVFPDGRITGAICNCCADCYFPNFLTKRLHAEKVWLLTRYVAHMNKDCCTVCGRCVRRCPFDAFTTDNPKKSQSKVLSRSRHQQPTISFNADLCRGCGLYSTGLQGKSHYHDQT